MASSWKLGPDTLSWCNTLSSKNPYSQELSRIIGAVEAQFGIRVSAAHLAGAQNTLADLGSRPTDTGGFTTHKSQPSIAFPSRLVKKVLCIVMAPVVPISHSGRNAKVAPRARYISSIATTGCVHPSLLDFKWYRRATTFDTHSDQTQPHSLVSLHPITDFSNPRHRVLYGATVQGFFFLLRRSEYLTVDGRRHEYCIQVRDLHVLDAVINQH
ncbi:hypothetical protein PHMEG_00015209 [Phytophthora megakarya]|uniref:Uncharacterized protein n=1 Tax=Phytophthora megakarya TaxID=4795 RepID=A0A225W1V5_9STRA|nr:hypothetical protein PHMEG_00015209 [Phytophthora megakarya]